MKSLTNFIAESSECVDEALNAKKVLKDLYNEVIPDYG